MLSIYRRHRKQCQHTEDRISKKCRCTIWATGTLEGKPFRRSLKTRSFERAEQIKRNIENGNQPQQPKSISVKDALDSYIKASELRNLSVSTLKKYRLLRSRLLHYAGQEGLRDLTSFEVSHLHQYRSQWNLSPLTASKEIGFLRAFFSYCVQNGWLQTNPAKAIKLPHVKINPRLPFSEKEINAIISKARDDQELAFLLTLRHSPERGYHSDFPDVTWERPTCGKCGWAGEPVPIEAVVEPRDKSRDGATWRRVHHSDYPTPAA